MACRHTTYQNTRSGPSLRPTQTLNSESSGKKKPRSTSRHIDATVEQFFSLVNEYQDKTKDQSLTEFGKIMKNVSQVPPDLFKKYLLSKEFDTLYQDELGDPDGQPLALSSGKSTTEELDPSDTGDASSRNPENKDKGDENAALKTAGKTFLVLGLLGYGSVAINTGLSIRSRDFRPSTLSLILIQWAVASTALYLGWEQSHKEDLDRTEKGLGHWVTILNGGLSVWGAWNMFQKSRNFKKPVNSEATKLSWMDYIPTNKESTDHLCRLLNEKFSTKVFKPKLVGKLVQGTMIGAGAIGAIMGISRMVSGAKDLEKNIETNSLYLAPKYSQDLITAKKIKELTVRLVSIKKGLLTGS